MINGFLQFRLLRRLIYLRLFIPSHTLKRKVLSEVNRKVQQNTRILSTLLMCFLSGHTITKLMASGLQGIYMVKLSYERFFSVGTSETDGSYVTVLSSILTSSPLFCHRGTPACCSCCRPVLQGCLSKQDTSHTVAVPPSQACTSWLPKREPHEAISKMGCWKVQARISRADWPWTETVR